jgi:hypothetical protein
MTETWVTRPISTDPAARLPTRGQPSMLYTEWPHSTLDFRSLHPQKEPSFFGSFELGCQAPATVGMDRWQSRLRAQRPRRSEGWGQAAGGPIAPRPRLARKSATSRPIAAELGGPTSVPPGELESRLDQTRS